MANTPRQDLLEAVDTFVASIAGIQEHRIGVPKPWPARVTAYTVLADPTLMTEAMNAIMDAQRVLVGFGYAVEQQPENAELALAGMVDGFIDAWYTARKAQSGIADTGANGGWSIGAVEGSRGADLDGSVNARPEYLDWSNTEVRHLVFLITLHRVRNY